MVLKIMCGFCFKDFSFIKKSDISRNANLSRSMSHSLYTKKNIYIYISHIHKDLLDWEISFYVAKYRNTHVGMPFDMYNHGMQDHKN